MRFDERIGAVLVSPRRAFAAAAAGPSGRGLRDVGWLLAARVVCGETLSLVRAVVLGAELGPSAGWPAALGALSAVIPDAVAILIGAVLLMMLGGRRGGDAHALDLAAYAWVPYLAVELAGALAFSAAGRLPGPVVRRVLDGAALAWATLAWALALYTLRARSQA
jgi:hypothetical protein